MRPKVLAVIATVIGVMGVAVLPSMASAESSVGPSGPTVEPSQTVVPLNRADCPSGYVCGWTGPTYGGERRQWAQGEVGCHTHEFTAFESIYDNTGVSVYAFGWYAGGKTLVLNGGEYEGNRGAPWYGELCIT